MNAPRITRIESTAIRAVGPSVLVRVWADDVVGLGECYPSGPAAAIHRIVVALEEALLGEDPRNVERLAEKLRRRGAGRRAPPAACRPGPRGRSRRRRWR
jgi:galactonate dehydratase